MHSSSNAITTAFVGLIAASAITVSAAPLVARNGRDSNNGTSTSSSTGPLATVLPSYTSTYHSNNGAVDFHVGQAVVSRHTWNNGADTSALVTFEVPAAYSDRQCQLVLDLTAYSAYAYGSQKAQIFTSLAPATASASTWPSGNVRNRELGAVTAVTGGRATYDYGSGYFPCNEAAGRVWGAEVVPRGDNVDISWPANVDGLKVIVW